MVLYLPIGNWEKFCLFIISYFCQFFIHLYFKIFGKKLANQGSDDLTLWRRFLTSSVLLYKIWPAKLFVPRASYHLTDYECINLRTFDFSESACIRFFLEFARTTFFANLRAFDFFPNLQAYYFSRIYKHSIFPESVSIRFFPNLRALDFSRICVRFCEHSIFSESGSIRYFPNLQALDFSRICEHSIFAEYASIRSFPESASIHFFLESASILFLPNLRAFDFISCRKICLMQH